MVSASEFNITTEVKPWLTKEYYSDVLNKEYGKYEIINFHIADATDKGENYASVMNRISIDIKLADHTDKTVKFIVKSMIQSEKSSSLLDSLGVFPKEMEMYEKIVPEMEKTFQNVGSKFTVGPKCYKTQDSPSVIVLEDLSVDGYKNINRLEGMDLNHIEATLEKLAKFHAASARMFELNGPYSTKFNHGIYSPELISVVEQLYAAQWPTLSECMRQWGDCEKYLAKISPSKINMKLRLAAVQEIDPDEFNVLTHGDMWSNNVMFKYNDNGSIDDLKFVDLQMCKWGSPVLDLQYFIISSCSHDIRIPKYDYFVKFYHGHLINNLKLLKFAGQLPKLVDLQIQMLKRGYYSITVAFGTLRTISMDPDDAADMETLMDQSSERAQALRKRSLLNPRYSKAVKAILEFAEYRGIL